MDKELIDRLKKYLWAKSDPYKSLIDHLIETGIVAEILCSEGCFVPIKEEIKKQTGLNDSKAISLIGYLASIHDIGKIHPAFVANGAVKEAELFLEMNGLKRTFRDFRHEENGAICLRTKLWADLFPVRVVRHRLSSVIKLHHQRKKFIPSSESQGLLDDSELWDELQKETDSECRAIFSPPSVETLGFQDVTCMLLLSIVICADWIASGDSFAGLEHLDDHGRMIERTKRIAKEFIQKNNLLKTSPPSLNNMHDLWPFINDENIRPLQTQVDEIFKDKDETPLALIIEAPMGEGKTEAAFYAADKLANIYGKGGFYIGLPTAATSNQMYGRVNTMLSCMGTAKAKLMHSMAWLMDDYSDNHFSGDCSEDAPLWTTPMRRGLITSYAVGTIDQAMLSVCRARYSVLRLGGLAEKVLIIDEMHAYDAYMSDILYHLLSWCRAMKIPVIILSATLPYQKKKDIADKYGGLEEIHSKTYPSITTLYDDKPGKIFPINGTHQKLTIQLNQEKRLGNIAAIADLVLQYYNTYGGCLGIILNTVKEAQQLWDELIQVVPKEQILLFHARFDPAHRNQIEDKCISWFGPDKSNRPQKAILIATQVVEQSLDIDLDKMITAICPIDLLLQRIGRMWRHEITVRPKEITEPCVTVLTPTDDAKDFGVNEAIYAEILLKRTLDIIKMRDHIQIPDDIPELVSKVYDSDKVSQQELDSWYEHQIEEGLKASLAERYSIADPNRNSFCMDMSSSSALFSDDETQYMSVSTRMGEPSIRFAFLSEKVYDKVKKTDKPDRELAKEVMMHTVTVSSKQFSDIVKETKKNSNIVPGKGLLSGIYMVQMNENKYEFDNGTMVMDPDKGLIIFNGR